MDTCELPSQSSPTNPTIVAEVFIQKSKMKKKSVFVGVEKKNKSNRAMRMRRRNKKTLLRNVIHYLKSDCYMYAPLLSTPPNTLSHSGEELSEHRKRDAKRLLGRVVDYLKSDSYLYAPLIVPESSCSPAKVLPRPFQYTQRVTTGDLSRTPATKYHLPNNKSVDITNEDLTLKGHLVEARTACQQMPGSRKSREMVKHMVYQNSHCSTESGA